METKKASYIPGNRTFQPKPSKIKKQQQPPKKFLTFQEMVLLTLRSRNFLYFLKRKLFVYFLKKSPSHFLASALKIFPKKTALTKFLIFCQKSPKQKPQRKILMFQETELSYISGK